MLVKSLWLLLMRGGKESRLKIAAMYFCPQYYHEVLQEEEVFVKFV